MSATPLDAMRAIEPFSVRIPVAVAMSGLSRSRIYELIAAGEIQVAKDRRSTLVIVESLRAFVAKRVLATSLSGTATRD